MASKAESIWMLIESAQVDAYQDGLTVWQQERRGLLDAHWELAAALHHLKSALHQLKSALHPPMNALHHLNSALHHLNSALHQLKSVLHQLKSALHQLKSALEKPEPTGLQLRCQCVLLCWGCTQ